MAAAAASSSSKPVTTAYYSYFRDAKLMSSFIKDQHKYNMFFYFVHGKYTGATMSVPDNNIVIQTGAGESFGCIVDTSIDVKILKKFVAQRKKTFNVFLGQKGNEDHGILEYFLYNVEKEPTIDKIVSLSEEDKTTKSGVWGIYQLNPLTSLIALQEDITKYLRLKPIRSSTLIEYVNKRYSDKPNIHVFINCTVIPKNTKISNLLIPGKTHHSNPVGTVPSVTYFNKSLYRPIGSSTNEPEALTEENTKDRLPRGLSYPKAGTTLRNIGIFHGAINTPAVGGGSVGGGSVGGGGGIATKPVLFSIPIPKKKPTRKLRHNLRKSRRRTYKK